MEGKGIFITFEGLDGCGKSTQVRNTATFLRSKGCNVLEIRDPGSTTIGEAARAILLNREYTEMAPMTELLLFAVARSQLVSEIIKPALEKNMIVLSDRFYDSTTAYQGYGRKLDLNQVRQLNRIGAHGLVPDITFIFDIDPDMSVERMKQAGKSPDRMENEHNHFRERVRDGFLSIGRDEPDRCIILDGCESPDRISMTIQTILSVKNYV
jgi:dTMP kinase